MVYRHLKELRLDFLLNRKRGDRHIVADGEIARLLAAAPGGDVPFVVVATPVEEIGRDHDFDKNPTAEAFSWDWFNPFAIDSFAALLGGFLVAVFIFWGFDAALSMSEETADAGAVRPERGDGDSHHGDHLR